MEGACRIAESAKHSEQGLLFPFALGGVSKHDISRYHCVGLQLLWYTASSLRMQCFWPRRTAACETECEVLQVPGVRERTKT